jgi:hypothetical protein
VKVPEVVINTLFRLATSPSTYPLFAISPALGRSGDYGGRDMDKILKVR